jgi:LuxR family maltose regulon positive regulatory protein
MTELRTGDLRLTTEETGVLLELNTGRKLRSETIKLFADKTDGWAVGLRLAALSIREMSDDQNFADRFKGTSSSAIVDYLASEVLSRQSAAHQEFLLRTSILDRFNAELCDAILSPGDNTLPASADPSASPSRTILRELSAANLFLLPLDQEGRWYRYHHLFRDLLHHRLQRQHNPEEIAALHDRASRWFEQNELIEEALDHAFSAGHLDRAVRIVSRQRYTLMNQARWQHLDRYLRRFSAQFVSHQPDLLMLKTWLVYHQGHWGRLPAAIEQLEATLGQTTLPSDRIRHFEGEISALRSLVNYFRVDVKQTMAEAVFSIKNTPPELWIVRILARLYLAAAYQMRGELGRAYDAYYQGLDEEVVQSNRFKATLLMSSCSFIWIAADLQRLENSASQCIALCDFPHSVEIKGYGTYHLARTYYQRNDLDAAEEHFATVVRQPHLNYGNCFADSAFSLGLTYQAQNRPDEARETASLAVDHMLDTGNTTLLPLALAFQAEIALRQGQLAMAGQWAAQLESAPPLTPMFRMYEPHFTLAKIWLAQDMPASRRQAAELLDHLRHYAESGHNIFCLIQALALLSILRATEDDEPAALALLEEAIELAEPGGFIRLFVDLGPPMARLLHLKQRKDVPLDYLSQILDAFPKPAIDEKKLAASSSRPPSSVLVESLTPREMEVLVLLAQRLTNKEIAEELVVSPDTVKTHTLSIYAKLDVHGRRQAVDKASEIGLISPT